MPCVSIRSKLSRNIRYVNGVEGHFEEETVCLWACRHSLPVMCQAQEPDDGTLWMLTCA